ncbi:hypothetical protein FOA43_000005 [Brettanomyces nanus]|uniref:Xylanolytic transcriptional activator regulatory domain-containing protein n=1 Tax=Eeniella nana TaxID=13502 RepID=A0A875RZR0_EENNA|nr:uncharacterized protein FOA43_000005 [Brettanomyces nanus]QPG72704.1 hypothetical protein FOA43_000005 [Brettanomyces nanus]
MRSCDQNGTPCLQKDPLSDRLLPRDYTLMMEKEVSRYKEIVESQRNLISDLKQGNSPAIDGRVGNGEQEMGHMQRLYSSFENSLETDVSSLMTDGTIQDKEKLLLYTEYYTNPIHKSLENEITEPIRHLSPTGDKNNDNSGNDGSASGIISSNNLVNSSADHLTRIASSLTTSDEDYTGIEGSTDGLSANRNTLIKSLKRLPTSQFSNYLLKIYLDNEYPIYPILNQVDTYANFYQIAEIKNALSMNNNAEISNKTLLLTFSNLYFSNLIFALAASNLESTHTKEFTLSNIFYNRDYYLKAVYDLAGIIFDRLDTITKLQAMVLLGQIALCRPCFPGLWNISSLISSIVTKQGFFDESIVICPDVGGAKKIDLKRRCFWAAYLMDRYVCLCLSKPHLIDEFSITTRYFSTIDDECMFGETESNTLLSTKQYSIFYIKYFRTMSEINALLYSNYMPRLFDGHANGNDKEKYFQTMKIEMQEKLNITRKEVESFELKFKGRSNFYAGYLTLLYYQAVCLLYKPNQHYAEPSVSDYRNLYDATGRIIDIFKGMSDKHQLTYRILSVSSLFFASVMYNYCVWKCDEICLEAKIEHIQQRCNDSKVVFQRIDNFYNADREHTERVNSIVSVCTSVLTKLTSAAIDHIIGMQQNEKEQQVEEQQPPSTNKPLANYEDVPNARENDDQKFFGSNFDVDSPFDIVASLENIPWDLNIN